MKRIWIVSGLLAVAAGIWGLNKVDKLKYAFDNMTIDQYGYPKDIDLVEPFSAGGKLRFKTSIILRNRSYEEFALDGGVIASLKRLAFIYRGQTIGYANVDISVINVPAVGQTIIDGIPVEIPTQNILTNIANIAGMIQEFKIVGYIEVLGTEYLIGQ